MPMERKVQLKRYTLDNSALFYPIMASKKAQSLFRISVVLCDKVDGALLEDALNEALVRFPAFKTKLKMGYAWHYLGENLEKAKVFDKSNGLLKPINPKETNGFQFRLVYEENRIYLEMFHGICDGTGAIAFLKGVLQKYRQLQGVEVEGDGLIDFSVTDFDAENEDSCQRHYTPIKFADADIKSLTGANPQLIKGTLSDGYSATTYYGKYSQIGKLAKDRGVTFTAFMSGVLAHSLAKINYGDKPIVIMVPVNLRAIFESKSVRNFVTFVRIVFDRNNCEDVEACILEASKQLTATTRKEELNKMIATQVRAQKTGLLKIAPLWVKMAIAKFLRLFLKSRQTTIISNLGRLDAPECLGIEKAVFNINVSKNAKTNLGVVTAGDTVAFTFTKSIEENTVEDTFVSVLNDMGGNLQN